MYLDACDGIHISSDMKTYPDGDQHHPANKGVIIREPEKGQRRPYILTTPTHIPRKHIHAINTPEIQLQRDGLGDNPHRHRRIKYGANFIPDLYTLKGRCCGHRPCRNDLRSCSSQPAIITQPSTPRDISAWRHDACVFRSPLHVPMDVASWRHHFAGLQDYGINPCVSTHGATEAAFQAADEMGIYLSELPFGEISTRKTGADDVSQRRRKHSALTGIIHRS